MEKASKKSRKSRGEGSTRRTRSPVLPSESSHALAAREIVTCVVFFMCLLWSVHDPHMKTFFETLLLATELGFKLS